MSSAVAKIAVALTVVSCGAIEQIRGDETSGFAEKDFGTRCHRAGWLRAFSKKL
jgi:hypothetical protein